MGPPKPPRKPYVCQCKTDADCATNCRDDMPKCDVNREGGPAGYCYDGTKTCPCKCNDDCAKCDAMTGDSVCFNETEDWGKLNVFKGYCFDLGTASELNDEASHIKTS